MVDGACEMPGETCGLPSSGFQVSQRSSEICNQRSNLKPQMSPPEAGVQVRVCIYQETRKSTRDFVFPRSRIFGKIPRPIDRRYPLSPPNRR